MNIHAGIQLLIKRILKNRARNGFLAVGLGLLIVVGALYIDVLRGDVSGTIGLYQIVGALAGYTLSAVGAVMIAKETDLRTTIQKVFYYSGAIIFFISVLADYIGVAGAPGFDKFQILGAAAGILLAGIGFYIAPDTK